MEIQDLLIRKNTSKRRNTEDVTPYTSNRGQTVLTSAEWTRAKPEEYSSLEHSLRDTYISTFKQLLLIRFSFILESATCLLLVL
jgi:hypothetical protein